jgi:predicted 3-demethylubiquinone-9 3-methyltransferase (glyoxalase superfamily)
VRDVDLKQWDKEALGKQGTIIHATFKLNGNVFMCSDSPPVHDWDFTPAVSNYVECEDESQMNDLFTKLMENGEVTMPLANFGFNQKFGWVIDPFCIVCQLNLK